MKTSFILKPLSAALVLGLSAGAWADLYPFDPQRTSAAVVLDGQSSSDNEVTNEGTINDATLTEAINSNSGNVGANVAAGDNNQQANAASLSSADAAFVFAGVGIEQSASNNTLNNYSNPNTASLSNAINGNSGNVGANIAAGNYNQQKNDAAIAVSSSARGATAMSAATQTSAGNSTDNNGTLEYRSVAGVSLNVGLQGSYEGTSNQTNDVYPDIHLDGDHPNGGGLYGHIDYDNQGDTNDKFEFAEQGTLELAGSASGRLVVVNGFATPVTNSATLTNSVNGNSGNVGVNIAAGGGNQQSNSLAIAAGCQVCAD
ncbi:hypothetical protein [Atopomonas sediminilitoris]|uniref:hypothetical protein n=1 Tax=Atopomonas sediminilitoris TaxID=2919919 RepID=UPI001F4D484D|nr:hypothetical protein [Atopomonas sediminilitoris]MCJ8167755.1 hypothetical protein [Atopomonas sediminilitoris]